MEPPVDDYPRRDSDQGDHWWAAVAVGAAYSGVVPLSECIS